MAGSEDDIPPPPPPPSQTPTQQTPHTVSTIKLPILKKREYDIWAMKIEHYLAHTDYPIWKVIQRVNGLMSVSTDTNGLIKEMQKYILKKQFEGFSVSNSEGLHKGYDRFQSLLSQLEIHGAGVSTKDANQKFLRVFESDVKGSTASSSNTQNVAFISENTGSTNDVSTAYGVSNSSGHNSQYEHTSSYSLLANQSSCRKLPFDAMENRLLFGQKTKVECYSCHKIGNFARECRSKGNQDSRRRDAWNTGNKEKDNGRRSGKQEDSKALVTLDGEGVDWTSHSKDEHENYALMACSGSGSDTEAYTQALKKVEAQLVAHQQNQLWYEEKIRFMKIDLDDKTDVLTYHKKLLTEMSAKDKVGLGTVPLYMTGGSTSFPGPDKEIDDSQFTYGPKQSKPSESDARSSDFNSCEIQFQMSAKDKAGIGYVWSDAPIIEEYESDSEDEHVSLPTKEQEIPSFAFINTVKHVKTPRQTVKEQNTCSQSPKPDKKDCSGLMSKKLGLGYGFTKKACFVCGSFSHLIRDCDFHEKRMAKQAELNKRMCKGTGQRENRTVWNNVQRVNHQNQFVPTAVLTRTGRIQVNTARASSTNNVNTARHNFNSQAVPTNAARKVNTVKPIVNNFRPKTVFHKTHSPIRRPLNRTTAPRTKFSNQKVNTAEVKAVSAVGGKRETADYPQRALKSKRIVDSGCSRHMTGSKAYLAEYQDYNGGHVAFGGSKGYITGKGKIKTRKLDFEDVCFVKELQHFNLFSVSQMCDKKNKVLFTDTKCLVLSPDFKLPDENQVLLIVPRQNNMYNFNLKNIIPSGGLACLIAKATVDESNKWHRKL
ncbi:hypothetical protein Tco_0340214 [Tanacetum coccineum]